MVAVTHDRYFLDNVAGWILELDRGQGIPFEGNYSEWLRAKSKRLEVQHIQYSDQSRNQQYHCVTNAELNTVHDGNAIVQTE